MFAAGVTRGYTAWRAVAPRLRDEGDSGYSGSRRQLPDEISLTPFQLLPDLRFCRLDAQNFRNALGVCSS
jgi:hypothetical protein